jgi:hypothetical protein
MSWISSFQDARDAGVPIIIIRCPDNAAVMDAVVKSDGDSALTVWDINRGVRGLNTLGMAAANEVNKDSKKPAALTTGNPQEALMRALEFMPSGAVLFMENAQLLLECREEAKKLVMVQCVANCRDPFKSSGRTLVLLCPDIKVPIELRHDVIVLDVPLPDAAELTEVVTGLLKAGQQPDPTQEALGGAVAAITGLSRFVAENAVAMSLRKSGLDLEALWERKISAINAVGGLTVSRDKVVFDQIGGLNAVKAFCKAKVSGKRRPRIVVLVDEITDQMSGRGDSNGINRDAQGQMLQCMQNYRWSGALFHGFAGTGKTEIAKAMGCEAGGLFVAFDMGAMKGGIVGDSEKLIRDAMNVLYAMGGEDVFFIGTTNSVDELTPQMKRRFGVTFFFDLLKSEEQLPIWDIYIRKFKLDGTQKLPDHEGWTGAEIRRVCELADEFGISLIEASKYISPVVKAMGDDVETMRQSASGKYLSAAKEGYYETKRSLDTSKVRRMIDKKGTN